MNIHLQVSDDQGRVLSLDGDLDLLEQLFATIRATRDDHPGPVVSSAPRPITSSAPRRVTSAMPRPVDSIVPKPTVSATQGFQKPEALGELSPIAKCYQIAAARGRALRLARERASALADEDSTRAESSSTENTRPGD